jgi:adenosylcobinamide kinase/adenosylcobinamide-phosphate guanylyltransferase
MLTLLLGGARSGKSRLAVELAQRSKSPVTFIATAEARDEDLTSRIARHRSERPQEWRTVEEPIDLQPQIEAVPDDVIVIDCLTLWVSNLFEHDVNEGEIVRRAEAIAQTARTRSAEVIVVSNEVGSGIIPVDELSRRYRDALGRVNASFSLSANTALLVVAGRTLTLSPAQSGRDFFNGSAT